MLQMQQLIQMQEARQWACTGHHPTTWAFGEYDADTGTLKQTVATVVRQDNGTWDWRSNGNSGNEPSCKTAMMAAYSALGDHDFNLQPGYIE